MKRPCMAGCEATNRMVIRDEVLEGGGAPEWGGEGVRRVGDSWSTISCNLAVKTTHHQIPTIPGI
jgi:hypothetical protein